MAKWGVWAVRSACSFLGAAEGWCKDNGKEFEFSTEAKAEATAKYFSSLRSKNFMSTTVQYFAKERDKHERS